MSDDQGMAHSYDGAIDIGKDEALTLLEKSAVRARAEEERAEWLAKGFPKHKLIEEVLIDGTWRKFCRTDECDDVCTTSLERYVAKTPEQVRARYINRIKLSYGVRLGPARFAIIDAMTDG